MPTAARSRVLARELCPPWWALYLKSISHHQGIVGSVKLTTLITFYFLTVERILLRALPAHGKVSKCHPQSVITVLVIPPLHFSRQHSVYSFLRNGQRLGEVVHTVNPNTGRGRGISVRARTD